MYQYRWNRKYRWKPEVFVNCYFWLHIRRKYAIYISFDSKFYFWFDAVKIFEIRPRKFIKSAFFQNAWAELKFRLQIRIQRKISRRIVRVHTGVIVIIPVIRMKKSLRGRLTLISAKIITKLIQIQYYNVLFDAKFYAEFEFVVEILIPPTHFEKMSI